MKPVNWMNDHLLFDAEPSSVNEWLNANDLLEQNREKEIFLSNEQLNLYPIMVRKNDFVRKKASDRIMARFPFLVVDEQTQTKIEDKILLLSEFTRDYFYKSINKTIMEWKKDILKYLSRGTLPFPVARCCFELVPNLHALINETSLRFTSARGEAFKMPTLLTKDLAYLAGMVNGDGNLQKYTLRIVDFSIKNIKQLQTMFQEYFDQTGNIIFKTPNSPEVVITNLWVVRLFSFLTSQPIGIRKYAHLGEPLIFKDNPTTRSYYWSGVMDADGSYKNKSVTFSSVSLNFVEDFKSFLLFNNIETKLTERDDNTVTLYIPACFHIRFSKLLKCLHPEKKIDFDILKKAPFRTAMFFIQYNESSLINGYFDLRLINNLSITGLGETIRHIRGKQTRRTFIDQVTISERSLYDIEKGKMSINIKLLDEILKINNQQLMPFLAKENSCLYHIRSSEHVRLPTHPSKTLSSLLKPLLFHKKFVRIPENKTELVQNLVEYFRIIIQDNKISNKLLVQFFSIFCKTKFYENQ